MGNWNISIQGIGQHSDDRNGLRLCLHIGTDGECPREDLPHTSSSLHDTAEYVSRILATNSRLAKEIHDANRGWRTMDSAPKGIDVLVCEGRFRVRIAFHGPDGWTTTPGDVGIHPTHWQPLPPAPKGR